MKLHLSVFNDGLISKWDSPLPKTLKFVKLEGCPVDITLTPEQVAQVVAAQQRAAEVTHYNGKVRFV
jgi:hypothetical protein